MKTRDLVSLHRLSAETSSMLKNSYLLFERLEKKEDCEYFQGFLDKAIENILKMREVANTIYPESIDRESTISGFSGE